MGEEKRGVFKLPPMGSNQILANFFISTLSNAHLMNVRKKMEKKVFNAKVKKK